jgi:hypothetical protein
LVSVRRAYGPKRRIDAALFAVTVPPVHVTVDSLIRLATLRSRRNRSRI